MGKENKSYRIRTNVNNDSVVNFTVDNTIDTLDILSLSIDQKNTYRLMGSNTGIIAGRVLANGGFGVPNVKVSVFIPYETTEDIDKQILYSFTSTRDTDNNGVRYNLLPNELDDECHQNIGTFPSKRVLLDNNNWIDGFDKYYQFTTRTNESGDYMIYGVPVGTQTVHMDVDLSDIGILSQKPRDLIYKGYNANMFENTTKFKVDTNIDSLAQVITQDQSIYVYPFWGDTTDTQTNAAITRCDMNINYKFEPTCIFMGSVITDAGENAMSQKCVGGKKQGNMSDMITGEGKIEMIRKTPNGQVEQFSVQGDNNINSDGVWCYQIPMNLDYVMTDEFGKMVMTDNPNTGIPTRARVRFRLSMAETPSDVTARKRARFLIPNNPHLMESDYPNFTETKEIDYEFGTKTKDENFRDLMWNNVYTVKSYIPRLQKSRLPNNLRHLGIKMVNHSGANNPMPFNNLRIKFNFMYMFLCTLVKVLVTLTRVLNAVLTTLGLGFYFFGVLFYKASKALNFELLGKYWFEGVAKKLAEYKGKGIRDDDGTTPNNYMRAVYNDVKNNTTVCDGVSAWFFRLFLNIGCGIALNGLCETDDGTEISVTPGTNDHVKNKLKEQGIETCNDRVDILYNCIENQLAQDNEVTSFNFYNDWINGVVYLPLWYRRIKKRINGEIKKDDWCSTDNTIAQTRNWKRNLKLYSTNMIQRTVSLPGGKTMGKIIPLVNNENTVLLSSANNETGRESIIFSKYDNDNCYGYQCHKYARSYFKVYKGLIYEKETMLGDKVYYYKPCDYDTSTGNSDLVTLFATDLVLLGSLNECDMHGIPQFFKCLESTTYNMPPDLLSESYDYTNENNATSLDEDDDSEIDLGSRITEYTGADWGNLGVDQSNDPNTGGEGVNENQYDNGGLFYGITCFDSYTKPKSTINLPRICELGVSLDETTELPSSELDATSTESDSNNLTPDGFVSYDEIYNPDYRSMFATLNSNFLRTKLNPETGLIEYDFNHIYLDNFDGSLELLMKAKTVNGKTEKSDFLDKANYVGNYNLEKSSDTYLNFRYGDYVKRNNKKIYFYENNNISAKVATTRGIISVDGKNRQPRFENSFYFYFGLNEGKTAIDKFNNEFFSDCTNKTASDVPYDMTYQGNSWCPPDTLDGFIAFNMNVDAPYTVKFTDKDKNDVYYQTSINQSKFIFSGGDVIPEGYEKYRIYNLIKKANNNSDNSTQTVEIIPSGRYTVELTDGYDNVYYDEIVFELPRIGFVCDVNPFNCKNSELLAKFDEGTGIRNTYTNIANCGYFEGNPDSLLYSSYEVGYIIKTGEIYYTFNSSTSTYVEHSATTNITVMNENEYYYKHEPRLDREIYGFISLSDVSESDFRIELKPINEAFFGNNYTGTSVIVNVINDIVTVTYDTQNNCGYLGHVTYDDVTTFYFGVPYGNQRYRITVTQLCFVDGVWIDSKNVTTINVIVYEDEFKMYINGIDYDVISGFNGGWNDYQLENGVFEDDGGNHSSFAESRLSGWDDILNIGKYTYGSSTKSLTKIGYTTLSKSEVIAICEVLSTTYEHNGGGVGSTTPYTWTDEYCFNAPSYNPDDYEKGSVQKNVYTYTIAPDVSLYDVNGNPISQTDIQRNVVYYTDQNHIIEAVLDEDYFENVAQTTENVTRYDSILLTANYYVGAIHVARENENGEVTYVAQSNPNIEYVDLACMSFLEYREFIDSINDIIDARGEFSRQVAGVFRINDSETMLTITSKTKARPVRYLIVGNEESSVSNVLYDYRPNSKFTITTNTSSKRIVSLNLQKTSDINNTKYASVSNDMYIMDGYVVDKNLETYSLTFKNPTLTCGTNFRVLTNNEYLNNGDLYYIKYFKYKAGAQISKGEAYYTRNGDNYTRNIAEQDITVNPLNEYYYEDDYKEYQAIMTSNRKSVGQYKYDKHIAETIYRKNIEYEDYWHGEPRPTQKRIPENGVYYTYNKTTSTYIGHTNNTQSTIYLTVDGPGKYFEKLDNFAPYHLHDKTKHPYYVSIINDNNSILPPSNTIINFDNTGGDKNLVTTFPVHFYNKPLKSNLYMLLAFINNIPAYPEYALAQTGNVGWLYPVNSYEYYRVQYTDTYQLLPQNTVVYVYIFTPGTAGDDVYYKHTVASGGETVGNILAQYPLPDPQQSVSELYDVNFVECDSVNYNPIIYDGDYVYVNTVNYPNIYTRKIINNLENGQTTAMEYLAYLQQSMVPTPGETDYYNDIYLIGASNSGVIKIPPKLVEITRYYIYDDTVEFSYGDVYYLRTIDNNEVVYQQHIVNDIPETSIVSIRTYKSQRPLIKNVDLYGYGVCYYPFTSQNPCCDDLNGGGWAVRKNPKTNTYVYNNGGTARYYGFFENGNQIRLEERQFSSGDVYYVKGTDDYGNNIYTKQTYNPQLPPTGEIYGGYKYKSVIYHVYYSNFLNLEDITTNWKGVDVFMPGFMCGYLYNGIPRDEEKSNIRAEYGGQEIKLYTNTANGNDDIYSNINVKRMIYTDYPEGINPTYGEYTGVDTDISDDYKYQYSEIPLLDDDLIYTDGYGDEYRYPIAGTLSVLIDNPVLVGRNNTKRLSEVDTKYDDFLKTRTFYTNNDGYTRHQSLYYVFDTDYTEYPLYYYDTGIAESPMNSNLRYDAVNNRYYFTTMPELLMNIDNKVVSGYVSKSKSVSFNITNYIREKYNLTDDGEIPLNILYPNDKFFVIAKCDDYYTISPVVETQWFRVVYNYNGFDNRDEIKNTIYITARNSRDYTSEETLKNGIHYIEDFYYMLYYRFTVRVSTYDVEKNDYNSDLYTQVCSVPESTAEHCYIKVTDKDKPNNYEYHLYDVGYHIPRNTPFYYIQDGEYKEVILPDREYIISQYHQIFYYKIRNLYEAYKIGEQIPVGGKYYLFETNPTPNPQAPCTYVEHTNNTTQPIEVETPDTYYHEVPDYVYWASAIKISLSSLGTDAMSDDGWILPWLHVLIEDKSGVIRKCNAQTASGREGEGVEIEEFEDMESMMDDYNNPNNNN